ncbi:MAG: cytochrome c biogenesis protein CcdA [Rhodospirillaceae bacterium]
MITDLGLSFLAGGLSTLSPCVLPLLPILLGGALQQHRWAPVALAVGLATSFTAVGLFAAGLGFALGIDTATIRMVAAALMAGFGMVLVSTVLGDAFGRLMSPLAGGAGGILGRLSGDGLGGQFALGLVLGMVWSPCAGPTLGAAIGLAAASDTTARAAVIMAVFSLGTITPLLLLAYGSRQALAGRRERLAGVEKSGKTILGVVLLALGLLILTGFDRSIEAGLTKAMPSWLLTLTTRY